jgi:hypothetical protein
MRRIASTLSVVLCAIFVLNALAGDAPPVIDGCQILPADNLWNRDVSNDAVDPKSQIYINDILTGSNKFLKADFASQSIYGIPYVVVSGTQVKVPINIVDYADESDAGPFPIPATAPVEGGSGATGDRHVIVLDKDNAILYELFNARLVGAGWECSSSAKFDLKTNVTRPDSWTSADAAGLPILPGLARYEEVAAGKITHALRFTVHRTSPAHLPPATHHTSGGPDTAPPMGLRMRLKSSFDTSTYTGQALVILNGLKKYGMMVADNGSDWFISGAPHPSWDDDDLRQLLKVPGSAFEAVIPGSNSGGSDGGSGGTGGSNIDTDGDGFPDELETALNTSPTDAATTPFGTASAGTIQPLEVTKLSTRLNFAASGKDSIQLSGLLPIPDAFSPLGQQIVVDVGGVIESFTLDARGAAKTARGALKIGIKAKKGAVAAQTSKFLVKLKTGGFATALADEGLTGAANVIKQSRNIGVILLFNQALLQKTQPQVYSAKAAKAGSSK